MHGATMRFIALNMFIDNSDVLTTLGELQEVAKITPLMNFRSVQSSSLSLCTPFVDHKVRHPRCVYSKLDCSVYTCLTQLHV